VAFWYRSKKIITTLLKILITVLVIAFIIHRLGWRDIVETVAQANVVWLIMALALFIISGVLGVVQWQILLRYKGIYLTFFRVFTLYFIGMFFSNFVFGIVAGDAVKVALIKASKGSVKAGFAATLLDRFVGLWSLMGFAIAGSLILLKRGLLGQGRLTTAAVSLAAAFVIFCVICVFLVSKRVQHFSFTILNALPVPGKDKIKEIVQEIIFEAHDRYIIIPIAVLSIFTQAMRICVHILCAESLGLLTAANFQYFFIFVPILAIVMLVPLPFGVKEGLGGSLFLLAGFSPDTPEAPMVMEFIASLTGIIASLLGGIFFISSKIKVHKDR